MRHDSAAITVVCLASFSGLAVAASIVFHQVTVTTLCENFQPKISGDGKKIVFLSDCEIISGSNADQNYEVFLFDTEKGRFLQITDTKGTGKNNQPVANQDGSRIAFTSSADLVPGQNPDGNPEIFLYDTGTKGMTQVTRSRPPAVSSSPSLSGDGDTMVFLSSADHVPGQNRDGKLEVFRFGRKAGRFTQLTHTPSSMPSADSGRPRIATGGAAVTRDGTRVVISSAADLVRGENREGAPQFFLYDLARKTTVQLTHMKAQAAGHPHGPPAVSDDGSRIAFIALIARLRPDAHEDHGPGGQALFLLEPATGKVEPKASNMIEPLVQAADCQLQDPSISGDGSRITLASTCDFSGENKDPGGPNMEIFLYHVTTKVVTQLTHTTRDFNHTPSIDRSGARIAFGSDRDIHRGGNLDENSEIFFADVP